MTSQTHNGSHSLEMELDVFSLKAVTCFLDREISTILETTNRDAEGRFMLELTAEQSNLLAYLQLESRRLMQAIVSRYDGPSVA